MTKAEVNEKTSLCGFVRRTFLSVWQRLKWARKEVFVVLQEECVYVSNKGENEWGNKFMWFCEKNDSKCVTKVKVNKDKSLCGFVIKTFFSMW